MLDRCQCCNSTTACLQVIRGDPNELLVKQISLLTSTFHHWNGKIVTYPNHVLFNSVRACMFTLVTHPSFAPWSQLH